MCFASRASSYLLEPTKKCKKRVTSVMELNHLNFQSRYFPGGRDISGGAGNRTQIETGQHEIPARGIPQRHVLPLLETMLVDCGS